MLTIGDRFYIGRSVHIRRRTIQHKYELEKLLCRKSIEDNHYKIKLYEYLKANPDIDVMTVGILEECSYDNLMECEQKWLDHYKNDPNCVNVGFIAKPSSHDTKMFNKNQPCKLDPTP